MNLSVGRMFECCRYRIGSIVYVCRIHECISTCDDDEPSLARALDDAPYQLSVTWTPHKMRTHRYDSKVWRVTAECTDFGHSFTAGIVTTGRICIGRGRVRANKCMPRMRH